MIRRTQTILFLIALMIAAAAASRGQERPNIIFILSDDQGIDAIEGEPWPNDLNVHMPTIEDLGRDGRIFRNVRVNPYCSPTRACMLTGRNAFSTGVTHVINQGHPRPERDLLSLQTDERTIADVLRAQGYYTIFIDKWHTGWDLPELMPGGQGFDVAHVWPDYIDLDDPVETGDEHTSLMVDLAIQEVENRPNPDAPYALFFWSIDGHKRNDPSGRVAFDWWEVDSNLLPSEENYYGEGRDSNRNRYRAVMEAFDTEMGRLLRSLDVIESDNEYRDSSDTVVIYTSDNGTPPEVAPRPDRAKGTLYDGGVRVPLIVFGEDVPSDGQVSDRLIGHVDFFETIADIIGASPEERGSRPRTAMSFADSIGWSDDPLPRRDYTLSSLGHPNNPAQHLVAVSDGRYKLIARGGGRQLAPRSQDEFYDLGEDPTEDDNLMDSGMSDSEEAAYIDMRTWLTTNWPSAVANGTVVNVDLGLIASMTLTSDDNSPSPLHVGHVDLTQGRAVESRAFLKFNIASLDQQLPQGVGVEDIESAEIVVGFQSDSSGDNTDTGAIRAYAVNEDWTRGRPRWSVMSNAHQVTELGIVDLPPHIIPNPPGNELCGTPIEGGTPISWGPSAALADQVREWYFNPGHNHGVVLIADPLEELAGDQRVRFLQVAGLRLTLRQEAVR